MKTTEAQQRAIKKYHQSLDDIKVRVPKGDRQKITDHAASQGESMTGFIRRAIAETMERDNQKDKT